MKNRLNCQIGNNNFAFIKLKKDSDNNNDSIRVQLVSIMRSLQFGG